MRRNVLIFIVVILSAACSSSGEEGQAPEAGGVPFCRIRVEPLPDLNKPRGGGALLLIDGELTRFGGHTDGYIPLATAEYLKDGAWHEVPANYSHDFGFITRLPDGRVMLGGGAGEHFGIGQSWGVEIYDKESHTFQSVGILDRKRSGASACAMEDGRVVVSGNWYAPDAVGIRAEDTGFSHLRDVGEPRSRPYILQSGPGEVIIFGGVDNYGKDTGGIVDRSDGESYPEALLEEWAVTGGNSVRSAEDLKIGEYDYLVPASAKADKAQCAFLRVNRGRFSLLETEYPLPKFGPDSSALTWGNVLQVDRASRAAWLLGHDEKGRLNVAQLLYDPVFEGRKASLKVWFSEPVPVYPDDFVLLGDGRLACAGGVRLRENLVTNFETGRSAFILSTNEELRSPGWLWWLFSLALIIGLVLVLLRSRKSPVAASPKTEETPVREDLMSRMVTLMEKDQVYRQKGFTKADMARLLGTNVSYVSACINTQAGTTFPDFVASYRIRHAQGLMKSAPGMLISDVAEESGFSSEQSFFRTFKAHTGMTPQEWKKTAGV